MATLTIRNLDEAVVARLKERARAHNRSLEAEVREILADSSEPGTKIGFREFAERLSALTPDVPQTDSTTLIREDRDR